MRPIDAYKVRYGFNYINESLDEVVFGTKNCIKALNYEEDGE